MVLLNDHLEEQERWQDDREAQCKSIDIDFGDIKEINLWNQATNLEVCSEILMDYNYHFVL